MELRTATCFLALLCAGAPSVSAFPCSVPGTHATLQAAIDEPTCDPIQIAEGDYPESLLVGRSVTLEGPVSGWATLWGRFEAQGAGTVVAVAGMEVRSGCSGAAVEARDGARIQSSSLHAEKSTTITCNGVDRIFEDGFEGGDTSRWSANSP